MSGYHTLWNIRVESAMCVTGSHKLAEIGLERIPRNTTKHTELSLPKLSTPKHHHTHC
jgi:hypothetical protein